MKTQANALLQKYSSLLERLSIPRQRIALNVFRVIVGSLILLQYLLNYSQRHFLFGPNGAYPWELFMRERQAFSLYQFTSSPLVFDVIFHVGILVTALWVLGKRTRLLTPVTYLFWYSLRQNNPLLWDGGDNLMQLVLVYACFADLSPLGGRTQPAHGERSIFASISGLFHNAAVLAIGLQVCLLYGVSALAKVQGETWQNGTALYYALWPEQFRFPGVSDLLYRDASVLAVLSHATVFFQVAFPFMFLLNRYTRHVAVAMAITFHIGIASVMGLFTFAGFMIAADLALISDDAYLAVARKAKSLWRRLSSRAPHSPLQVTATALKTSA